MYRARRNRETTRRSLQTFVVVILLNFLSLLAHARAGSYSLGGLDGHNLHQVAFRDEIRYRAAVVEYNCPTFGTSEVAANATAVDFMMANVQNYKALSSLVAGEVDIVVFPEYGITSLAVPNDRKKARPFFQLVADPANSVVPCDEYSEEYPDTVVVKELSCLARELRSYVVVDLAEVAGCESAAADGDCPEDGVYFFNTAVVFDRNGTVIARYRKINLYLEPQMNYPPAPTPVSFTTDFGVEFGLLICFDIMFQHPMIDLYERGIRDFVYPTAWVDAYPMFLAHQVQSFTALGLNANLMASGYHHPPTGSLGSGIYSTSQKSAVYAYSSQRVSRILVSDVVSPPNPTFDATASQEVFPPLDIDPPEEQQAFLPTDVPFKFTALAATGEEEVVSACDGPLCCHLAYSIEVQESSNSSLPNLRYSLGAFHGRIYIQNTYTFVAEACVVFLCTGTQDVTCGQPPEAEVDLRTGRRNIPKFDSLALTADFATPYVYPSGIDADLELLVPGKINYRAEDEDTGSTKRASLKANVTLEDLVYAGLYARLYDLD